MAGERADASASLRTGCEARRNLEMKMPEWKDLRILVQDGERKIFDVTGVADRLLERLCHDHDIEPMAVIAAALVQLSLGRNLKD